MILTTLIRVVSIIAYYSSTKSPKYIESNEPKQKYSFLVVWGLIKLTQKAKEPSQHSSFLILSRLNVVLSSGLHPFKRLLYFGF